MLVAPFLKIVEMLVGGTERFRALGRQDRERAATYLERVAMCLNRSVTTVPDDETWRELRVYGREIPQLVKQALGKSKTEELQGAFWSIDVEETWLTLVHYGSDQERVATIAKIKQAVGQLNGLATTLRTT